MPRHAFTLLEVMIVLALLTILGAIVIPTSIHAIGARSVAEAPGRLEAMIAETRAMAQRAGTTMRITGSTGSGLLRAEQWTLASVRDEATIGLPADTPDLGRANTSSDTRWERLAGVDGTLPAGLTIRLADDARSPDISDDRQPDGATPTALALLTPDGVVRTLVPFEVVDAGGIAYPVRISGLTGRVTLGDAIDPDGLPDGPLDDAPFGSPASEPGPGDPDGDIP